MADQTQTNQQSQQPTTQQPFFDRIKQARTMGYQDNAILSSIAKANPNMAPKIQQATTQGISPTDILKQISMQSAKNYGQSAHDEGVKAQQMLSNPLLQFGNIIPSGTQVKDTAEKIMGGISEIGVGGTKGVLSTAQGISDVAYKAGQSVTGSGPKESPLQIPESMTKANTPLESLGKGIEQTAEFMAPESIETKAIAGLDELSKAGKLNDFFNGTAKFLTRAATTGTVTAAQTGSAEKGSEGGLIASVIMSGLGTAGKALSAANKWEGLATFMGKATSYPKQAIEEAFKRSTGAVSAIKEGQPVLNDVIAKTNAKIFQMAGAAKRSATTMVNKMESGMKAMYKESTRYGEKNTFDYLREQGGANIRKVAKSLDKTFNIGINENGKLDFDRAVNPSNIVSSAERNGIQDAFDTLQNAYATPTIKNIDATYNKLVSLLTKTPAGSATGPETKSVVNGLIDETMRFTKELGKVDERYGQYADFVDKNITERVFWEKAKDFFGNEPHLKGASAEADKVANKLVGLYTDMKSGTKAEVEGLQKKAGTDLTGPAAATAIKEDVTKFGSMPASARGWINKALDYIPRKVVQNFIKTGTITGLESNPVLEFMTKVTGMSIESILKEAISQGEQNKSQQ